MIREISHPVVKTLVNRLRKSSTDALRFRQTVQEITRLLAYEAFNDERLQDLEIETWQGRITSYNVCYTKLLRVG